VKFALYALGILVLLVIVITAIGYALPQNHVATVSADVPVPPARVFERISDPARYGEWRRDVTVEVVSSNPLTWREKSGGDVITYAVAENQPASRFVARIADKSLPFGGTWTYELEPAGSGTRLRITEHGEVYNPIFRFMSKFVLSQTASMEKFVAALQASFKAG
jgi:hypothetical protein